MTTSTRYACFISYKHGRGDAADLAQRGDSLLARMLQQQLHRLARPFWKLRALHVFRDEAELAAGADLPGRIQAALQASGYLLLLACPQAAQSQWVRKEIRDWLLLDPRGERLILGLTEGDLQWTADAGAETGLGRLAGDAVAPELAALDLVEPQWIDLRAYRSGTGQQPAAFRKTCIEIAARLHGCTPDVLAGQDYRRLRQTVSALSAGLLLLAGATTVAWWQRNLALDRGVLARAGQLALESQIAQVRDPEEAAPLLANALDLLASRALPVDYDVELALRSGADALRDERQFSTGQMASRTLLHRQSQLIAVTADQIQRLDARSGRHRSLPLTDLDGYPLGVQASAAMVDGHLLLLASNWQGEVRLHHLSIDEWTLQSSSLKAIRQPMGLAVTGDHVYVTDRRHGVYAFEPDGSPAQHWPMPSAGLIACGRAPDWLCVAADRSPDWTGLAVTPGSAINGNARLHLIDHPAAASESLETPHVSVSALLWSATALVSAGSEGLVQRYRWTKGQLQRDGEPRRGMTAAVTALANTESRMAVGSRDGQIRVWGDSAEAEHTLRGHVAAIRGLAFEDDNACGLWSLSEDGQIRRWELCWPIRQVDSAKSWEQQSADGAWLGRASMTDVELLHDGATTRRAVDCAVAADRMVEILAISNRGDVLAKCPGTQDRQPAEWLRADVTQPSIAFPEDQHEHAWFIADDELIVATGSIFSTIHGVDLGDQLSPARLQRWRPGMAPQQIDLKPHGIGLTLALATDGQRIDAGTQQGKLLVIQRDLFTLERVVELGPIIDPAGVPGAVKALACCSASGAFAIAYGLWGLPASMAEQMRDQLVLYDPGTGRIDARQTGERRSTLALRFLTPERIVAIHGPMDAQDGYGDSARLRLFDSSLRPLGVDIALQGHMFADIASLANDELSVVALPRGRLRANLGLQAVEARIRSADQRRRRIVDAANLDARIQLARAAGDRQRAKALASEWIQSAPDDTDGWQQRGLAELALGDYTAAAKDFEAVLERDPMNLYAPLNAAKAYIQIGDWERAEAMSSAMIERAHLIIRPPVMLMDRDHPLYAMNRSTADGLLQLQRGGRAEPVLLRAKIRLQRGTLAGARDDLIEVRRLGVDNEDSRRLWAALAKAEGQTTP